MGVGIVATRPINQGEQIFISYSGDDAIKDTWGEIFQCYCCQCQRACVTRSGGPTRSKRMEPVGHQGIRTSESEQSPKKARLRFHQPDKRKRNEQGTPDLGPSCKRPRPPVPQDIPEAGRSGKHVGDATKEARDASAEDQHRETSGKDRGGEQDPNIKAEGSDATDLARSVRTDETDKVNRESIGGSETVFDPHQGLRDDMNLAKDEHLPQAKGSDIGRDDQNRDGKGQSDAIQWSDDDQNMDTNADDSRGISERDEKKCADTSNSLMLTEEEQWKAGRPNRETIAMDMEADNTNVPRNEDSDLQLDTGTEYGTPENGLRNMDRENTRKLGAEMETALPRGLDEPSGDQYLQTGTDPIYGKKMGGQPDAVGDASMTTDSAPSWHNKKLNPRIDLGDSEEGIEQQDGTEAGMLQGNEAGTATRSRKRQTSVRDLGDTEASGQLKRDIRTGDHANGVDMHMQDETGRIEHLAEESEGRGQSTAMKTENSGQHTKDAPEATTREQSVKEQEAGESESPLEAERGKNTATGGVHENRDPETKEDRHTKPSSDERRRKSNDVGQGAQPLAPVEIAKNIAEKNYVSKTLALLSPPKYNQFTNIVSAYDVDITGQDLARLQIGTKLNDGNIDWMMRWWTGQVNGGSGRNHHPHNPIRKCLDVTLQVHTGTPG